MPGCRCAAIAFDGRHDVRHVGVLRLAQRRRHADVDRVELGDDGEVGRRAQASGRDAAPRRRRSARRGCTTCPALTAVDLARVEVDAGGVEAGARELDGERQPDVAEADDADAGASRANLMRVSDAACWMTCAQIS